MAFRNDAQVIAASVRAPAVALFLPSLAGGGAERVFVELANEFSRRGLPVDLVLASADGPYLAEVSTGVRIVDLKATRVHRALPGLVRYLRAEKPAAMLSALDHANLAAILARRLAGGGTRVVISLRSVPTEVYRRASSLRSRLLFRFLKIAYRHADAIIANSQAVAVDAARLLRIPAGELKVIYNPLNLGRIETLAREAVAHDWCANGAPPLVLGVGSLTPLKDFGTLIHAFALVRARRECRLVILGEGPERDRLVAVAREGGVAQDMLLPGFVPNPFAWMSRAAVFVGSSLTEGCPNALMQALALDLPIVSTECGGAAELLAQGQWGRLVPAGMPGPMAAAIEERLEATARADTRRRAADFSHQRIGRMFLDVLLPMGSSA